MAPQHRPGHVLVTTPRARTTLSSRRRHELRDLVGQLHLRREAHFMDDYAIGISDSLYQVAPVEDLSGVLQSLPLVEN